MSSVDLYHACKAFNDSTMFNSYVIRVRGLLLFPTICDKIDELILHGAFYSCFRNTETLEGIYIFKEKENQIILSRRSD